MTQLAEPAVSFLLENISKLLVEEGKFLSGVGEEAQQLQSELKLIRSLLKDAEEKQDEAAVVREWILQTKDLAYEADHVIESYAFEVGSSRRGGLANVLKRYSCILAECYKRHKFGLEIQALKTRVSGLTKNFQDYGIRGRLEKEGSTSQQQQLRRTYSHIEEYDFVGLESDVEMLMQHLVNDNEVTKYRAISIFGMGGLGKTTIAKRIYNHPNVKRYFDGLAWVCISQQWQKVDILRGLLIKLIPEKRDEIERWRDEELVRQLLEVLEHRKCLIVLDDIWSAEAWESIKPAFPARDTSSKILLTTRNKDVALQIDPIGFHHELRLLSDDESWELLQKKAFIERYREDNTYLNKMKELGRKMVEQCGGLPLVVVVLGGILAKKHSLSEWEAVYGDVKTHLGKGKSIVENQIQKILALSYTDLPDHLKLCFLYLGSFSEDAEIDAMTLYQLWFTEGILSMEVNQVGETPMLNVAERYLGELAERCMVNVKLAAISKIGRFESCRLHDLMRKLCLLKAEEENFLKVINYSNGNEIVNSSNKVRRIVINVNTHDVSRYVPPSKEMAKHFRMLKFVISGEYMERMGKTMKSQFSDFKMVRILFIENLRFKVKGTDCKGNLLLLFDHIKVPKSVGTLIHLRYLSFKYSFYLTLPKSLANLKHLQTLDLRGDMLRVPNILWTMSELRYLYLPRMLKNKLQLDGLSKLEILENFNCINCEVKDLLKLTNLRVLTAKACSEPDSLAIIIDFTSSSNSLQFASIEILLLGTKDWSPLIRPLLLSRNIQVLSLMGPTGNLPKLDPNNCSGLVKLLLQDCEIDEDPIEALEKLVNLRELWLIRVHAKEMVCHTMGFPKLKSLKLTAFFNLENWTVKAGAMPNLSTLAIDIFPSLELLPDGLRFVKTLKELIIWNVTPELKDRIQTSGEDFDKISHVPLVVIK